MAEEVRAGAMGLLTNPASGRNRRGLRPVYRLLAAYPGVIHREVCAPDEVAGALDEFAERGLDIVAINAGDGTVQAALTALCRRRPPAQWPRLALVPGGTTNMSAGDVGLRGGRMAALRKLLAWSERSAELPVIQRPVLWIQPAPGQEPICGLFFGTGVITKGIEYCHRRIYAMGLRDEWASGLALLRMLAALVRRDPELIAPLAIAVGVDGCEPQREEYLVLLASTLERLFLGLHPYWGDETGPLRYTAVRAHPVRPLRTLPPLFRGRANRFATPENGYVSRNVHELQLSLEGSFTLDGELYRVDGRSGPLLIRPIGPVSFIRV